MIRKIVPKASQRQAETLNLFFSLTSQAQNYKTIRACTKSTRIKKIVGDPIPLPSDTYLYLYGRKDKSSAPLAGMVDAVQFSVTTDWPEIQLSTFLTLLVNGRPHFHNKLLKDRF